MAELGREDGELSDDSPKNTEFADQDDFVIDRTFSGIVENEDQEAPKRKTDKSSVWKTNMKKRLLGEEVEGNEDASQKKRRRVTCCFNCRGDHNIAQCPEPRDPVAIRKNKMEFQSNNNQQSGGRISKAVENESKYRPGRLSQSLREALNLGSDDIPEWVYRMRRMGFYNGYPPGYLRKALRKDFDTIKMFTSDEVSNEDSLTPRPPPVLDQSKVFFFMGFNKTYGALRDYEKGKFEVPPFDVFCDILQKEATREHGASEMIRLHEESIRRQQLDEVKRRSQEEKQDEDIFVEDRNKTEDVFEERQTPEKQTVGALGESISQIVGTPVVSRRDKSGVWVEECLPSLEAFATGIVPFEAKEEDQATGTFQKIMKTLRRQKE